MTRRLSVYLGCTFALTYSAWGTLVFLAHQNKAAYGQILFMLLYAAGGLGPTVAAYVAVLSTKLEAPLAEFHRRLFRFRMPSRWYVVAVFLPVALTVAAEVLVMTVGSTDFRPFLAKPCFLFVPYWFGMVAGGGLEELGWRGIAQPELEKRFHRPVAALIVGSLWSVWHLPLFALPGVSQYGRNFPVFAAALIGDAMILAWLCARTGSIFACIMYHASENAAWAVVVGNQPQRVRAVALTSAGIRLAAGILLAQSARSTKTEVAQGTMLHG